MAKRAGTHAAGATPSRPDGRLAAPDVRTLPNQTFARIAILSTLLLLAIYAAFAVERLNDRPPAIGRAQSLPAEAAALAGRVEAEGAALRGALLGAREMLVRHPDPQAAADAGLRMAAGSAMAVAVVGPRGLEAVAGEPVSIDWSSAASSARADGLVRLGVEQQSSAALAGSVSVGAQRRVVALGAPSRLAALTADGGSAIVSADGRVLTPPLASPGADLKDLFGIGLPALAEGGVVSGRGPDLTAIQAAAHPALDGALYAVSTTDAAPAAVASPREILWVMAPLAAVFLLGLVLLLQSRKVEIAQERFVDSEQRFRRAVEAARCGIWEWDLSTDRIFMSDVTSAMLGLPGRGVVEGREVLERVSQDHRQRLRQALETAAVYGAFDVSFRVPSRQGGRPLWIDARGQAFGAGESDAYSRIIGVALDVTEERMAQARAQSAESRLRDAIESVSEGFVLWDRSGRLLMSNRNYRGFFSLEPRMLQPGVMRDQVNRLTELAIRQEIPSPDGREGVREAELHDGRWIQISEHRTAEGGLVMLAADITASKTEEEERRRNEEQLQHAVVGLERSQEQLSELARKYEAEKVRAEAANRAKSEFLANMSHELRTPLNAINGFSEIMVGEMFGPLGDKRYKEYAQDILNSGQHLLALINDILDMSKIEAGKLSLKFEPIAVEDVAGDAVRLVRHRADAAGLIVGMEFGTGLPEVEADYRAVKQVLLNLLSNAIKFTPRGGRVTVRAEVRQDPLGERVRISVEDTGIGIADEDLQRLARPFEQIENQHSKTTQGTGLGLALTKSLVEMHGGALDLRSTPGSGTTVSFSLPTRQTGLQFSRTGFAA